MQVRTSAKVAAVIAASALALTGCSGGNSAQPAADLSAEVDYSGTISILTKFAGEPLQPYFENVAKAYEDLHPDVKVELIQETDQSVKDKTKTLTASNALPDIYFTWTGNWAENFINGGLATDLTSVIGPDTEWGKTFGEASLDTFKYDDKYYAIPLYNNGKFMGYNTDIFNEVGVEVPETFEDLVTSCSVIKDAGYEPIAFGNKDGWPGLHYLQQLFAYNVPTDVLEADFYPETAKLDDPGYVKSLDEFKQLVDECTNTGAGTNGVLYSTAQQALSSGKAAMYYQEILEFDATTAQGAAVTPENFGIFPLPVPANAAGDPNAIEGAPEGYIINSKSENPQLAIDFMKFVTNMENATTLASPPYGQPSTVVGAVTEDNTSKAVMDGITQVNEASQIVIWLDTVTVPEVADAWLAGGEAIVSGASTAQEVLDSVRAASEAVK